MCAVDERIDSLTGREHDPVNERGLFKSLSLLSAAWVTCASIAYRCALKEDNNTDVLMASSSIASLNCMARHLPFAFPIPRHHSSRYHKIVFEVSWHCCNSHNTSMLQPFIMPHLASQSTSAIPGIPDTLRIFASTLVSSDPSLS